MRRTAALLGAAAEEGASNRDSGWSSTSVGQQDADMSDAQHSVGEKHSHADISLGGPFPGTRQLGVASTAAPEQARQPATEKVAADDKDLDDEPVHDAPHQSPPPPVRTLDDDIAEQAQASQPAGTSPAKPASKASAAATYALKASQGTRRAAGTVADPVVISDSDSEFDMPEASDLCDKSHMGLLMQYYPCRVAAQHNAVHIHVWLPLFLFVSHELPNY